MENNDLSKVFRELDGHFLEYLSEHGIVPDGKGFIRCLNPNHYDKHPSMHIIDSGEHNKTAAWCFSCLSHVDILHACNILDGKPISGIGFFEDTLAYLTKKYNIEYEAGTISNEARDLYQRKSATRDAARLIHSMIFNKGVLRDCEAVKHLKERGITEETIKRFKIGTVTNFREYLAEMKKIGWENSNWLGEAGLANRALLHPHGITIPIHDEKSNPVGFVTRTTKMKPNDKGTSKYINSIASNIYKKGEILFNYDQYKENAGPLVIVEGYLDSIYLTQQGFKNIVALGSTVLTDKHVDMLARDSVKNIILSLDGDEGGIAGTKLALERLSGYKIFKSIRIVDLPEGEDPDTIVRTKGAEKFKEYLHESFSPFTWTLKYTNFQDDPLMIVESAIPAIVAEESHIKRLRMVKELSKLTGVAELDIRKDVDEQVSEGSALFLQELKDVQQYVSYALQKRRLKDTKNILEEGVQKVRNLEKKFNNVIDNTSDFNERITTLRQKIERGNCNYGLITSNIFTNFERQLDGIPYNTCLTLVGGRPSAGKTCWVTSLGIDLIENNEDAAVFYMSIDDTSELMMLKMMAQKTGFSTSKIKDYTNLLPEERDIIIDAWNWVEKIKDRFILVDATAGNTPEIMEAHAEWFVKNYSDYKRVFLLDNFHKLKLPPGRQKTDQVAALSEKVKELTQVYDMHVMETVELRKMGESSDKPSPSDLKDSVQLEYDADLIVMVHNELQVKPESPVFWNGQHPDEGTQPYPFLELRTWKNKITGKTGDTAYTLDKYNLRINKARYSDVMAKRKRNAGSMKISSGARGF